MSLKLVKRAVLQNNVEENTISIQHYDTIIFKINTVSKEATALKNCSMTSNRQIKHAIEFFKPVKVTETLNDIKWGFSGERY